MSAAPAAADIVAFWREAGPKRWFKKDTSFDDDIRRRFLALHEAAAAGKLTDWEASAEGALALLILLDQFPRNMFRGEARAFATDPLARAIAAGAIVRGFDGPCRRTCAAFSICRSSTLKIWPTRNAAVAFYKARRRRRRPEMGGNSRRYHPPFRPVSAPQRGARPRHHAGGTGLPRRRRVCRLIHTPGRCPPSC